MNEDLSLINDGSVKFHRVTDGPSRITVPLDGRSVMHIDFNESNPDEVALMMGFLKAMIDVSNGQEV